MPSALSGLGLRRLRPLCVLLHQPWRTMSVSSSVVLPVCRASAVSLSRPARLSATIITLGNGGRSEDMAVQLGGIGSGSFVDRIRPNRARLKAVLLERSESGLLRRFLGRLLFAGKVVGMMIDRRPEASVGILMRRSEPHGKFSVQDLFLLGSKDGGRACLRIPWTTAAFGLESRPGRVWFQTWVLGRIWIRAWGRVWVWDPGGFCGPWAWNSISLCSWKYCQCLWFWPLHWFCYWLTDPQLWYLFVKDRLPSRPCLDSPLAGFDSSGGRLPLVRCRNDFYHFVHLIYVGSQITDYSLRSTAAIRKRKLESRCYCFSADAHIAFLFLFSYVFYF